MDGTGKNVKVKRKAHKPEKDTRILDEKGMNAASRSRVQLAADARSQLRRDGCA
jgi:hypothetical protein